MSRFRKTKASQRGFFCIHCVSHLFLRGVQDIFQLSGDNGAGGFCRLSDSESVITVYCDGAYRWQQDYGVPRMRAGGVFGDD